MSRNYETLDAVVVVGSLVIIASSIAGLLLLKGIDQNVLPIIAGLLGTLLGSIVGAYAGFRWGNSAGAKHATDSLAQIAGAGPPPPAAPLQDAAP